LWLDMNSWTIVKMFLFWITIRVSFSYKKYIKVCIC
jgi:hypothetical protein